MKAIALTNKGIEDISKKEIKELINKEAEIHDGFLTFEAEQKELFLLCYKAQSLTKVIMIADDPNKWTKDRTFAVRSHEKELEIQIAEKIKGKVDLKNPDITFYAIDENNYGIDLTGEDLSKRDYRVFLGPESIKGTIAYALMRLSEYDSSKSFLDPFCRDGIIPIEAAIFAAKISPNYYHKDKFAFLKIFPDVNLEKFDKTSENKLNINAIDAQITHVNAAKKNAKIAGVNKEINFGRIKTNDLELKFQENSVHCIATMPPQLGKLSETKINEIYKEFFYNAAYILKGNLVVITKLNMDVLKKQAEAHKFALKETRKIMQGKTELTVFVFTCAS